MAFDVSKIAKTHFILRMLRLFLRLLFSDLSSYVEEPAGKFNKWDECQALEDGLRKEVEAEMRDDFKNLPLRHVL